MKIYCLELEYVNWELKQCMNTHYRGCLIDIWISDNYTELLAGITHLLNFSFRWIKNHIFIHKYENKLK